ncbi:unnamed protein product [Staurois parvus]|uniref:BPTI/Kunitz inhibitor domain-containing protein n=1 Tax=Staurois parvus TaxID=386267 RepID=A0ABN9HGU5_9NEOB|nr:unnamed protein product [Staurois parvus]
MVLRYYYNSKENRCVIFLYGGCNGNDNNFYSKQACESACQEANAAVTCQLPVDAGLCDNNVLRYYYDSTENKCLIFQYHGCFGNANNFINKLECEKKNV